MKFNFNIVIYKAKGLLTHMLTYGDTDKKISDNKKS